MKVWDAATGDELLTLKGHAGVVRGLAFSPDGRRLATVGPDGVRVWDGAKDVEEARAARREFLRGTQPRWHIEQGKAAEQSRQWFAAAFHLGRAIEAEPGHGQLYVRRGNALWRMGRRAEALCDSERALGRRETLSSQDLGTVLAMLGRWDEAAQVFSRLHDGKGMMSPVWRSIGRVCLQRGDREGYQKACATAVAGMAGISPEFAVAASPEALQDVIWLPCLAPNAVSDLAVPLRLAQMASGARPNDPGLLTVLGAALYRAGQHDQAAASLRKAAAQHGKGGSTQNLLFLAMAEQRLGHADKARQALDEATRRIDEALKDDPDLSVIDEVPPWDEQLDLQFLRREAEQLIRGQPDRPGKPPN